MTSKFCQISFQKKNNVIYSNDKSIYLKSREQKNQNTIPSI